MRQNCWKIRQLTLNLSLVKLIVSNREFYFCPIGQKPTAPFQADLIILLSNI